MNYYKVIIKNNALNKEIENKSVYKVCFINREKNFKKWCVIIYCNKQEIKQFKRLYGKNLFYRKIPYELYSKFILKYSTIYKIEFIVKILDDKIYQNKLLYKQYQELKETVKKIKINFETFFNFA